MISDEVRAQVAETRAAQGLGPTVTEPATLAALAAAVVDAMIPEQHGGGDRAP